MLNTITDLLNDTSYEDESEVELYNDYKPHKMSKREFVREMLRLQEEKSLYND